MEYFVIGPDGSQFGPAETGLLQKWATEKRIVPQTQLREGATGRIVLAGDLPALFPATPVTTIGAPTQAPPQQADWSEPPSYYPRPTQTVAVDPNSMGPLWGVIGRSAAAIVFFFLLHGIGVVFAGYAMFYAIKIKASGNKYGLAALVIAGVALVAVVAGWILRLSDGSV